MKGGGDFTRISCLKKTPLCNQNKLYLIVVNIHGARLKGTERREREYRLIFLPNNRLPRRGMTKDGESQQEAVIRKQEMECFTLSVKDWPVLLSSPLMGDCQKNKMT